MKMTCFKTMGAGALVFMLALSASANLVLNGSFEEGNFVPNNDHTMTLTAGSTDIANWNVVVDQLAWIGAGNPFGLTASAGSRFLDLSGYDDAHPYGGVAVSLPFATVPGQAYSLSFDIGYSFQYNGTTDPGVAVTLATSGGGTVYSGSSFFAHNNLYNQWSTAVIQFTAGGAQTILTLAGVAQSGGSPVNGTKYIGLDNVSVVPVPEPVTVLAGALLLLPVGASTLRVLRRRRGT